MASPAGDGALKPLQRAMKLAKGAIKLDTGNRHREAYVEYLKSVSFISQFLAEEAEQKGGEFLNSDSHKMLKVADQCLERARTTAGKLGKADVELMTPKNRVSEVPDPPATPDVSDPATTTSAPSRASMGQSWGHRRSCSDEVQKHGGFPSPEVFQMLRAAEAQSSKKELTPLQEASIQNQKLRATYEARLSRLDPRQAAQKTSLTLSLQRQMMENLEIAKAREETLQRKAEERRVRLQEESDRRFKSERLTPAQEEQKRLYTAVLEYEQDHRWTWICKQKIKSNTNDPGPVSNYVYQIFSIPEHPIARLVRRLQCQIYTRLYLIISKDPSRESSASDIGHQSLPVELVSLLAPGGPKLKSSQSLHCLPSCSPRPSIQHSLSISEELQSLEKSTDSRNDREMGSKDIESSFEDLEHLLSPSSLSGPAALERLSASQYLNTVVKEIHNARDLLVSSAVLSLDLPITPPVKEVCLECIDESFFPPLWPALLALYRQVLSTREESLLQIMELYRTAPPSVVGVSKRLYPEDVKDPYRSAAEDLEEMTNQQTPNKKLECIARTLRGICECADDYCATPGAASIGADDLLPILAFVILRSGMSHLVSECAALEEFIYEGYLIGEEGYCLTSLQSALVYLETLPIPPSPPAI
ncbi:VPS9 domain-containing protein 1 isoform X2 [Rana temporaria]|uniref:VPS9 domain-containing protein 1 isoform X2 n=1 Tax=Rana temporaria TaxID=8407 RepID=UPI001AACA123|nr:VPS9 domain-containing protein 1 isoform X2 [Rana temporaria]